MLKLVIFDMDGTICDSYPLMLRAMHEAAELASGIKLSMEDLYEGTVFGATENGILRRLLGDAYAKKAAELYDTLYEAYLPTMCDAPFDGVDEIFALLKSKGIKTALVTGKNRSSCMKTLYRFHMENAFDAIETGSDFGSRKREAMRAVLTSLAISPEDAIYVGDAPSDVAYAHDNGLFAVSALWASNTDAKQTLAAGPDMACRTVADFMKYIENTVVSISERE